MQDSMYTVLFYVRGSSTCSFICLELGVSELIDDCIKCYSFRVCTRTKVEQQLGSHSQRNNYSGCLRSSGFEHWSCCLCSAGLIWARFGSIPMEMPLFCQILMPGVGGVYKPFPLLCLAYLWIWWHSGREPNTFQSGVPVFVWFPYPAPLP